MKVELIEQINDYFPRFIVDTSEPNNRIHRSEGNITHIASTLIEQKEEIITNTEVFENDSRKINGFDERLLESLFNLEDDTAGYRFSDKFNRIRVYKRKIISELKEIYSGNCQICGSVFDKYEVDITEAHHIDYFSVSLNNNKNNIIILCPNHHTLIHKVNPVFDKMRKIFIFNDSIELKLLINYHL